MKKITSILLATALAQGLCAQRSTDFEMPDESQAAEVMQRVGITDIRVSYHSPMVKGRQIWGDVVPWNKVWRAGANENTTISFSNDVTIEGQKLAAGTYGLHMIPTESEWTIIFSNDSKAWGSFFYKENHDALRVKVKAVAAPFQEWLSYSFADPQPNSVKMKLHWEKLEVPVNMTVDVTSAVVDRLRTTLQGLAGFDQEKYYEAAAYCIRNNVNETEAVQWLDRSIRARKTFNNLYLKAKVEDKNGHKAEADKLRKDAMALAGENELNQYGYDLLAQKKNDEAIAIFKENVKRNPDSWNVYDSLAEAQAMAGDNKNAVSNYKTALGKAPADQKDRIQETIKKLEGK